MYYQTVQRKPKIVATQWRRSLERDEFSVVVARFIRTKKGKSRHTMIQDIAPHTWDITYKNIQPDPDSRVLFLAGDSFLCSRHWTSLLTNPIRIFIR